MPGPLTAGASYRRGVRGTLVGSCRDFFNGAVAARGAAAPSSSDLSFLTVLT